MTPPPPTPSDGDGDMDTALTAGAVAVGVAYQLLCLGVSVPWFFMILTSGFLSAAADAAVSRLGMPQLRCNFGPFISEA